MRPSRFPRRRSSPGRRLRGRDRRLDLGVRRTRRAGTSATRPPRAITAAATQIHATIGLTMACSPSVPPSGSMFMRREVQVLEERRAARPACRWARAGSRTGSCRGSGRRGRARPRATDDARDQRLAVRLADTLLGLQERELVGAERRRLALRGAGPPWTSPIVLLTAMADERDHGARVHDVGGRAAVAAPHLATRRSAWPKPSPCARMRRASGTPQLAQRSRSAVKPAKASVSSVHGVRTPSANAIAAATRRRSSGRQQRAPHLVRRGASPGQRRTDAHQQQQAHADRAPPCGRSTAGPRSSARRAAASTISGNTVPISTVNVNSTKSRLLTRNIAFAAGAHPSDPSAARRSMRSGQQADRPEQRQGQEDQDGGADRALREGVHGVEDAGARHERAQDGEQERGHHQRDRPALEHALALGEQRRVQRGGRGQPGQEATRSRPGPTPSSRPSPAPRRPTSRPARSRP